MFESRKRRNSVAEQARKGVTDHHVPMKEEDRARAKQLIDDIRGPDGKRGMFFVLQTGKDTGEYTEAEGIIKLTFMSRHFAIEALMQALGMNDEQIQKYCMMRALENLHDIGGEDDDDDD